MDCVIAFMVGLVFGASIGIITLSLVATSLINNNRKGDKKGDRRDNT